jgi:hypothetical protein
MVFAEEDEGSGCCGVGPMGFVVCELYVYRSDAAGSMDVG